MWGEHNGALRPLLAAYSRIRDVAGNRFVAQAAPLLQPVYDRQPILSDRGMSIEWLNWFTAEDIDRLYRDLITAQFYPESVRDRFSRWGFKEIRYREFENGMLRRLFPGMKVIILYRNPAHVFASQYKHFAKYDKERVPGLLNNIETFFQFAAREADRNSGPEECPLFISYEEIAADFDSAIVKLQGFLDEEFSGIIEEIGNDIARFRDRRGSGASAEDPMAEFSNWQERTALKLPGKRIQVIAECYEFLLNAAAAAEVKPAAAAQ